MFEFFFDYDSFDFSGSLTVPVEDPITDVLTGSDTPVTTGLDTGSIPTDPVDPDTLPGLITTDPTTATGVDQGSDPVESGSGAGEDVAISLDDFSLFSMGDFGLFSIDVFA